MENIGTQVRLPISTAFQIALQGIRIRLGRALVTISGVVLGIAFLMSVFTAGLIGGDNGAMKQKEELKSMVKMTDSFISNILGSPRDKIIGIVVAGNLNEVEQITLNKLLHPKNGEEPKEIRGIGLANSGVKPSDAASIGNGANLIIVMGDNPRFATSFNTLTTGMSPVYVLDTFKSLNDVRTFAGETVKLSDHYQQLYGPQQQQVLRDADKKKNQANFRTIWIMVISLLVTVIGITNSLLMSVTERFKEIGTMKCLGALSAFIRQLFLIESALIGFTGSLVGMLAGALLPMLVYSVCYRDPTTNALGAGFGIVFGGINYAQLSGMGLLCIGAGTLLSILAAIYPANFAARMVPAMALRSNV